MGTEQTTSRKDGYKKHQEAEAAHPDARKGAGWEKLNMEKRPWYALSSCAPTPIQGLLLSRLDFLRGKFGPSSGFIIRLTEECLAVAKDAEPEIYPIGTEIMLPAKAKLLRFNDLIGGRHLVEVRVAIKGKVKTASGEAWDFDVETRTTKIERPAIYAKPLPPMPDDPNAETRDDVPF